MITAAAKALDATLSAAFHAVKVVVKWTLIVTVCAVAVSTVIVYGVSHLIG